MTELERNELIRTIRELIYRVDKFKSCYFWGSQGNVSARKRYENYWGMPEFTWTENGNKYTAEFVVIARCNNTQAKGIYTRDGQKTTLTAIKNSLKRLEKPGQ